jgi:tetratricopeptide (TPR) repeat protein
MQVEAAPSPNTRSPRLGDITADTYKADPRSIDLNERAVRAVDAQDFKTAEDLFRQALAADAKNVTAAVNLAAMYLTNKKNTEATTLLEEYTQRYPTEASLSARLGDAYFASKRIKEAVTAYEKALVSDPAYPAISARLGTLYALQKRLPEAERLFQKAVDQDPRNGQLLASLSSVLLANGKPDMAVSTAKRALQLNPTKEVYITLGSAYEALNDSRNSLIAFERARDLGGANPELTKKIASLRETND